MTLRLTLAAATAAASLAAATPADAACVDVVVPGPVIAVCTDRPAGPPVACVPVGAATVCVTPS